MSSFHSLREQENNPEEKQPRCCRNLEEISKHLCLYFFMFISIVTLDLAQTTNDWLMYHDISKINKGLVYGPLDPYLVLIFLIICSVSSVATVFEILNLLRYLCAGRPLVDLDLISAIIVWFCDVSMLTINVLIALCHSEPVSYFQLSKAILVSVGVAVRILVPLARTYVTRHQKTGRAEKFHKSIYRMLTTTGVCLMLVGAVSIFIFTHTISSDDGKPQFLLPWDIWEGQITYRRYFANVGIYFTHENLKFPQQTSEAPYWVKLADIKEFYAEESIYVKLSYSEHNGYTQRLIINSFNPNNTRYKECYILDDAGKLNMVEDCTADYITDSEDIIFRFVYLRPHIHLILGDIIYNAKYRVNGLCHNLEVNDTDIYDLKKERFVGKLVYMKHETQAHVGHRLVQDNSTSQDVISGDSPQYKTQHFLVDVKEVWKMGMYGCDSKGRKGPSKNESVTLTC